MSLDTRYSFLREYRIKLRTKEPFVIYDEKKGFERRSYIMIPAKYFQMKNLCNNTFIATINLPIECMVDKLINYCNNEGGVITWKYAKMKILKPISINPPNIVYGDDKNLLKIRGDEIIMTMRYLHYTNQNNLSYLSNLSDREKRDIAFDLGKSFEELEKEIKGVPDLSDPNVKQQQIIDFKEGSEFFEVIQ